MIILKPNFKGQNENLPACKTLFVFLLTLLIQKQATIMTTRTATMDAATGMIRDKSVKTGSKCPLFPARATGDSLYNKEGI